MTEISNERRHRLTSWGGPAPSAIACMPSTTESIRCVIVAAHRLSLELLAQAVRGIPGLAVTATATDVDEADRLAALTGVDLLIVERRLKMSDGMDVIRRLFDRHPAMKCIVIADDIADSTCPPDVHPVVVSVVNRAHTLDVLLREIARAVQPSTDASGIPRSATAIRSQLTARQWELFVALGDGLSNKELGQRFGISTRTVETHRRAIARKLGVSGSALVRLAVLHYRMHDDATRPPMRLVAESDTNRQST